MILAAVLPVGGILLGGRAAAETLTVCVSGPPFCDHGSIQDAVDAASPGDTVQIFPGPYEEQVLINKDLTVNAVSLVEIRAPSTLKTYKIPESGSTWRPVLAVFGGSVDPDTGVVTGTGTVNVDISGVTVDGLDNLVPAGQRYAGIFLRNADGNVRDTVVRNLNSNRETFGILAYGDSDVTIHDNDVSGYSRGGIAGQGSFGDHPAPTVSIRGNTVTGPGFGAIVNWAPNGIQIGWGATGQIVGNTVEGNSHPSATRASGIIVAGAAGVRVEDNTVRENDSAVSSVGDVFFGSGLHTLGLQVTGNDIDGNQYGVVLQNRTDGTTIEGNTITGSLATGVSVEDVVSNHPAPAGTTVGGNTFAGQGVHAAELADPLDLDMEQVADGNDFDRAAITIREGDALGRIWSDIQPAVDAAADDDTVKVLAGTYDENVVVDKDIELVSADGREVTEIVGDPASTSLGTVQLTGNTTDVRVEGFTIVGFDSLNPGLEKAAVYLQGPHTGTTIVGNEIRADGEAGLLSEFGAALTGVVITDNVFSGKTFVGDNPAGDGFGDQFTLHNVPRQLVAVGSGPNATGFTFADNEVVGTAGGTNTAGNPQGNTLVTMDAGNSAVTGNAFAGTTTRFGTSLRARGASVDMSGNTFDSTGLTASNGHIFFGATTLTGTVESMVGANDFDRGAYSEDINSVTVAIQAALGSAPAGSTVRVLPATYSEDVVFSGGKTLESVAGSEATTIVGQATGWTGNVLVGAGVSGAHLEGFTIEGSAQAAIYVSGGASDLTVANNRVVAAEGRNALLTEGGQSDHLIEGNLFEGDASQLVYVNGAASVGNPSTGVDFVDNTFSGSNGVALGQEASNSEVRDNVFDAASNWAALELWGNDVLVTGNAFSDAETGLVVNGNDATLSDNTISGLETGVVLNGSGAGLSDNTITENATGVLISGAIGSNLIDNAITDNGVGIALGADAGPGHVARGNRIQGNGSGADNESGFVFDARENWWGAATGPVLTGVGGGDTLSGDVVYSPWCADPACATMLPPVLGGLLP